jgi:hypothetical protein
MQDARDFDRPVRDNAIHEKMASAPTMSRNMDSAQSVQNLASRSRPCNVRPLGKLTDRLNDCVPIDVGLPGTEVLGGPLENICEVELCDSAKANAPFALGH